jgi:hypothetical protein
MAHHLRCPHCDLHLYCRDCGKAIDADAHISGAVGERHEWVAFDPTRRNAWATQRGRILQVMKNHHPWKFLLAREMSVMIGISANQTCTRVGELAAQGLVRRTGKERPTDTNTPADEWRLTDEGLWLFRRTIPRQP